MLAQCRRQWANIGPTLDRCVVFAALGTLHLGYVGQLGLSPNTAILINTGCYAMENLMHNLWKIASFNNSLS